MPDSTDSGTWISKTTDSSEPGVISGIVSILFYVNFLTTAVILVSGAIVFFLMHFSMVGKVSSLGKQRSIFEAC